MNDTPKTDAARYQVTVHMGDGTYGGLYETRSVVDSTLCAQIESELTDALAAINVQGKALEAYAAQVEALTQSRKEHAVALAYAIFDLTLLRKQLTEQAITCNGALAAANDLRATLSAAEAREARLRAELLTVANAMPHTWIQSRALAALSNTKATP